MTETTSAAMNCKHCGRAIELDFRGHYGHSIGLPGLGLANCETARVYLDGADIADAIAHSALACVGGTDDTYAEPA